MREIPTDNKKKPQNKFKFNLNSLNTLIALSESKRGIRATFGHDEAHKKEAERALQELYKEFGFDITKPHVRPKVLTTEGVELASIAREFFKTLETFKTRCKNLPPKITIAAGDSIVNWIVLPAISKIMIEKEKYAFWVRQGWSRNLIELLNESIVDFIVVPEKIHTKTWKSEIIGSYEYCICCSESLLNGNKLNEAMLPQLEFAMITNHWELDFVRKAKEANIKLNIKIRCENFTQIVNLIKRGLYAGIVPASTLSSLSGCPWFHPEFMKGTEKKIKLVWKKNDINHSNIVGELAIPLAKQLRSTLEEEQKEFMDKKQKEFVNLPNKI